ncbi:MAG: helix-turn-helix transcriptional regulator [Sutterella wadsworthensis]|nr:helix-turn-helix transcriptional regulator [Sutterella wadsworthensis]
MPTDILHHYPTFPDDFIESIRLRRKQLGYSLDSLAEATGLTKKTLIRLEKGEDIRMSSFLIVMQTLDITFDYTFQTRMTLLAARND